MNFSVIVCMYNATEKNIKFTLDSVINQNIDDYEVIICDDGSVDNKSMYVEEYFSKENFVNYKMVMNLTNKGTVQNILSGLICASGEYVKFIGVGDALADDDVLSKVYNYMKVYNSELLFTDMKVFKKEDGNTKFLDIKIPLAKDKYIREPYSKKMKENIIVYNDQISGASMFFEREAITKYLERIKDYVIYMEDLVQYLFLLDGLNVQYYNKKCVKYEIGEGISTKKTNCNNDRMKKDKNSFIDKLFEEYYFDKYVKRRKKIENVERKYKNKIVKAILKTICEPKWFYYRLKKR